MHPQKGATELWTVGIVHAPAAALLNESTLAHRPITWLPQPRAFTFIADPFGIWRDGEVTLFVEALDYRSKQGEIHYYRYDRAWNLVGRGVALSAPHHLSYPYIWADGDNVYMLPEAHRSGKLTLYRATRFPDRWEPVATLMDAPVIDASIIRHEGSWWMFYALPGPDGRALRELHVAYADSLTGPWTQHAANPVRNDITSSRPGGTPFVHEGALYLPTQDCTHSYGEALHLLRVTTLTPDQFAAEPIIRLTAEGLPAPYTDGMHTLSACGEVTLIDVKHLSPSPARRWINAERRLRRMVGLKTIKI